MLKVAAEQLKHAYFCVSGKREAFGISMHGYMGVHRQTPRHAAGLQGGVAARPHPRSLQPGRLALRRSALAVAAAEDDDGCVVGIDLGTTNSAVVVS